MFDGIADRYDLVNRVMTFGMDVGWRRRTARALALPVGSLVLDLACGTGDLCRSLARERHRPVGVDFSAGMLSRARTDAPLIAGDVLALPIRGGAVDGITCGFALRNVASPDAFFAEAARVLRPGGRIALLEVSSPDGRVMRRGHAFYRDRVVPLIGGLLSERSAYEYLAGSFASLPDPDALAGMMTGAGFRAIDRTLLSRGIAQLVTGTRA